MTMRPAHVRHGHEETRRQAMHARHLRRQHRRFAAKAHRADAQLVGFIRQALFECRQFGISVLVFHRA